MAESKTLAECMNLDAEELTKDVALNCSELDELIINNDVTFDDYQQILGKYQQLVILLSDQD